MTCTPLWVTHYLRTHSCTAHVLQCYSATVHLLRSFSRVCSAVVYHLGVSPATSIQHNVCHDVESYTYGAFGIYLDQASTFVNVSYNLVYRTQCAGFFQHYGRNNTVVNNIFAGELQVE
jgi:parallel beta-helix repeat protein